MYFEPTGIYHIYNQGNNRQKIFYNRENYMFFTRKIRTHILNLMCQFETDWKNSSLLEQELSEILLNLKELEADGLVQLNENRIEITEAGRPFIRNVCMAFDLLLQRKQPETELFSMTV